MLLSRNLFQGSGNYHEKPHSQIYDRHSDQGLKYEAGLAPFDACAPISKHVSS